MNTTFGYCRAASAVPSVRPGAVRENVASMAVFLPRCRQGGVDVLVFPELCVTGYTCADLFYQSALLAAAQKAFAETFLAQSADCDTLVFAGLPVARDGLLFNCAVACQRGRVLGVVPKTFLPNTREFYEKRWFASAADAAPGGTIRFAGEEVPFGTDLVFRSVVLPECVVGVELCEDFWAPVPPSTRLALNGATVLCNLSASNELVGKADYRRTLVKQQSARCLAAYVYAGAGIGESTTDLVFGGHALIAENGRMLAENVRFSRDADWLAADLDVAALSFDRRQNASFAFSAARAEPVRSVQFRSTDRSAGLPLLRKVEPHPFVPSGETERRERCEEIFAIQSGGLATRLLHTGTKKAVIGISGGLDSALALLVSVAAFRQLGSPLDGVLAVTLPGFGTTGRTKGNSEKLCRGLGIPLETISILPACRQHLKDLNHPEEVHDITYENTQARERTQILMDLANQRGGLVVGTGDLSELALGWCTYNADHMSMYGVNGGVPKTLVRHLVRWFAETRASGEAAEALFDILATPVSPELLPADEGGQIAQKTEETLGPYEVHDFFLYEFVRRGTPPEKLRFLAATAFAGVYTPEQLDAWLEIFIRRFFRQQFKRSCLPDGPKVGSINLSPRGDWRMPSDASDEPWRSGT